MQTKKYILLTLCVCFSNMLKSQNPISPAGVYIADPAARIWNDGRLYIYGSNDISPKTYCSPIYHVLSTDNMKDWKICRNTFSLSEVPYIGKSHGVALFAPDCLYKNGKYYLYYCLSTGGEDEGVATGDSPNGPFRHGEVIKGISQIDPAVFTDDDGQVYYYWGQFTTKGAKLKPNLKEIDFSTMKDSLLTEKQHFFHEGSWMFKRKHIYYLVYTQISSRGLATSIGYSTSRHPLGPFKYGGVIIDNFGCDPDTWNNHGSVQEYKGKWYVFYHRSTHGSRMMRKACVEPITFRPDGSIPQVEMTSQGAAGPLNPFNVIQAEWACLLTGKMRVVQSGESTEELARIEDENTATFKYFNFTKIPHKLKIRVCAEAGGTITLFTNNLCLPVNAQVNVAKGDGTAYRDYEVDVRNIQKGIHPIYMRFNGKENTNLFRIDSFLFE
jgi:arabinoxylan arabinofuranohydrolase